MEPVTIKKNIDTNDDRDFEFLRRRGLEHIRELSHKLWTDYNSHDPGITILEALCYAITDLGNRIRMPLPDLLSAKENDGKLVGNFPSAKSILTTAAVTENDYRKLVIDIEGVKNAFIHKNLDQKIHRLCFQKSEATADHPQGKLSYISSDSPHYENLGTFTLKGLYDIYFEPDHDLQLLDKNSEERKNRIDDIKEQIIQRYHANRNLCEDLIRVEEVEYYDILVCGDIEIDRTARAADVLAEIMFRVKEYLSPTVRRYTLNELLNQGLEPEAIFVGPVLQNGFVPDEELKRTAVKKEIFLSDLIRIVKEVPGVKKIKLLKIGSCNGGEVSDEIEDTTKQKWKICLPEGETILPRLCLRQSIHRTNLFKDVVPVLTSDEAIIEKIDELIRQHEQSISLSYDDMPEIKGNFTDTGLYQTIQNDLPQLYGTGEAGLSPSLPAERHAKARQLKGYLLFFDQILVSYFGHLQIMGKLLSSDVGKFSYIANAIKEVKHFDDIVKNAGSYSGDVQQLLESYDQFKERKNRFLDHLLARFSENMQEYAFAMLEEFGDELSTAALWHKSTLLEEYPELGRYRSRAFNYLAGSENAWDTFDVSGFKRRISRLLGIRNYSRRNLTDLNFSLVEDEDSGKWYWQIFDEDGNPRFTGINRFDDELQADADLWKTVALGWNPANMGIRQTGDDFFLTIAGNGEEAAIGEQPFSSEQEAADHKKSAAHYLYNRVHDEGMFVFEHIVFLPDRDDDHSGEKFIKICMDSDCEQCNPVDPYSFRLTVILPGWTRRFSNLYFREYAESVIRREAPAHVLCRICWIGNAIEDEEGEWSTEDGPMQQLQELYWKWITEKMERPHDQKENEFLKPLVDMLHDLETIYPEGKLFDCDTADSDDPDSPIVLGKSTIGELKNKDNGNE